MTKLILVRHAQTIDNIKFILSGSIDSKISDTGRKQIKYLTNYLKDLNIDSIYTTTLSRTKETILEISKLKNIDIIELENLNEINFGDFEGMTFNDIQSLYPDEFQKIIDDGYNYKYPNGESLVNTYDRVCKEMDKIIKNSEGKTVLICSHGGTIRNIISYLITNTYENHWNFKIDNASVTTIDITDGFSVISKLNDTSFININECILSKE